MADDDIITRVSNKCHKAIQKGLDILVDLDVQVENLDDVELRLDYINIQLGKAEKQLESLEKCCGIFPSPSQMRKRQDLIRSESDEMLWSAQPEETELMLQGPPLFLERYNKKPTKGKAKVKKNRQVVSETDIMVNKLTADLAILRSMAIDMVNELMLQNEHIPYVISKANSVSEKVNQNNQRSKDLLNAEDTKSPLKLSPI